MNSLLVTAVITTFVLAFFLPSGNALVCYNCPYANCDQNTTCTYGQDTCLVVHYSRGSLSSCWINSRCDVNSIALDLNVKNFQATCCDWDLCNNAPNVVTNKIVLCGALLLTIIPMLKSLVGN
ncbi:PREDICTED: CD59B glycoprotein-like [Thamnophis sirtalis]|uniref:CD59B glycoprotein-like n=1 Tax=Thamnophis sirtalis TaxID=35019 RepID=A0A6I9X199_9SAUR|nr:PREDICTED: CD59B glycoprotein-like [Thamnophis sirtalis]